MNMVSLDGVSMTLDALAQIAGGAECRLHPDAMQAVAAARKVVERLAAGDQPVYGINTGFGALAETRISHDHLLDLQRNLILSHASGVGDPLGDGEVRALMALRIHVMAKGYSGVRPVVLETMLAMLNQGVIPEVPEKGSVGASGDLATLAHVSLAAIGQGRAKYRGEWMDAADALKQAGITPLQLQAKEGICMVNGTQGMLAAGGLALHKALMLLTIADIAGAVSLEGLKGTATAFREEIHRVKGHPGQIACAANLRRLLADSEIALSHTDCGKVQDPYSLRCMPQVHGASRDALEHCREVWEREANGATDNPLVFANTGETLSGGNFHGQSIALAFDYAAIAVAELANISERRIEQLVNPALSGLPPFLVRQSGLNSGYMIPQVAAASLVNENKVLCHPASVDSIPSSAGREDHVSMGMTSALKLRQVVDNTATVLAIELLAAAQAVDFHLPLKAGKGAQAARDFIRAAIPFVETDRSPAPDIRRIRAWIDSGELLAAVKSAVNVLE
ncbi:MAG: Histidine ammonia-lyase [Myxococcota bacterium]|nr:Histidine ammonia-lyase [Myxococcota bacterium]